MLSRRAFVIVMPFVRHHVSIDIRFYKVKNVDVFMFNVQRSLFMNASDDTHTFKYVHLYSLLLFLVF